ncbi:MAG: HNH endonuclease [bacterium]|nr:HNH endonuclease [bacterium]
MKTIKLRNGEKAKVDDDDFDNLNENWIWYRSSAGYAISNDSWSKMHRIVTKAEKKDIVDHINGDKLDNRKENLRLVSTCENVHNQKKRTGTKNNYKGTKFNKRLKLWEGRCRIYGQDFSLGHYTSEVAAGYAYNKKAQELSDYAKVNEFPGYTTEQLEQMLIDDKREIKPADFRSRFKYVYWHKKAGRMKHGKWFASVPLGDNKRKFLGYHKTEELANEAVVKYKEENNLAYNCGLK